MRSRSIAAAVLLALTLAACTSEAGDEEPAADTSAADSDEATSAATTRSTESSETPEATSDNRTADSLGEPVATRKGSLDGQEVSLDVYPLTRSGSLVVLNFSLSVDKSAPDNVSLYNSFGDSNDDAGHFDSAESVDGVKLLDGQNNKVYLVASDGQGNCLCTNDFFARSAEPGDTIVMTASYAAPPEDVTTVDVAFPNFGTVTGVPIQ